MLCPKCRHKESKVLESRSTQEGQAIRRRRECSSCGFRYSTYETIEVLDLTVIKRDERKEPYSFDKLLAGIVRAFEKRPVAEKEIKRFAEDVEREVQKKAKGGVIRSSDIGNIVTKMLKKKDPVAYLRFISVYLQFQNINDFQEALNIFPYNKSRKNKKN